MATMTALNKQWLSFFNGVTVKESGKPAFQLTHVSTNKPQLLQQKQWPSKINVEATANPCSRKFTNSSRSAAAASVSASPSLLPVEEEQVKRQTQVQPTLFDDFRRSTLDHVIESQQFDIPLLFNIFDTAREMEELVLSGAPSDLLKGNLMATLFYEPSTRTRLSFEAAMKRLGGEVLTTENAREFSSAAKGETLTDTIRTVEAYSDIIVLRHYESGSARAAAEVSTVPIINAGDGPGQHPTQALLDLFTIEREIGRLDDITIGLVGDLTNGRTVHSLAYLLSKFRNVKMYFVSPDVVPMKEEIKQYLTLRGVEWEESQNLIDVASHVDVIYQTRIQKERFGGDMLKYEQAKGKFIVDKGVMEVLREDAVVMHPLPRLDEIAVDVDSDPRAAYFRQAKNGLYIRMALLKKLLRK